MPKQRKYVVEMTWGEMKELISRIGSVRSTLDLICNFIGTQKMDIDMDRLREILMSCKTTMMGEQFRLLEKFLKAVEKEETDESTETADNNVHGEQPPSDQDGQQNDDSAPVAEKSPE